MSKYLGIVALMIVFLVGGGVAAQATMTPAPTNTPDPRCPRLVRKALDITQTRCTIVGTNEVCYGHSVIEAASRREEFNFDEPGDIEDIIALQSLSLSTMDVVQEIWGVMLMEVRAGLQIDTQDSVTMVFFGDTRLEAAADVLEVRPSQNVRARVAPSLDAAVVATIAAEQTVYATGRTPDSEWVRVQLARDTLLSGWVSASLINTVRPDEDLSLLSAVLPEEPDNLATFGPMQAFYFQSGMDDAPCEEAPNSGLLIQTPEGAAAVTIWIDEVIIELNATAFLQAQSEGDLVVNVIEGTAKVTALDETQVAYAGTSISVPLDAELGASEPPTEAEPFDPDAVQSLPLELLKREVTVPDPLDPASGVPLAGSWQFAANVSQTQCEGDIVPFVLSGSQINVSVGANGDTVTLSDGSNSFTLNRVAQGQYSLSLASVVEGEAPILYEQIIRVLSPGEITGESRVNFPTCEFVLPFTMTYIP